MITQLSLDPAMLLGIHVPQRQTRPVLVAVQFPRRQRAVTVRFPVEAVRTAIAAVREYGTDGCAVGIKWRDGDPELVVMQRHGADTVVQEAV
jgi:hypothetical protein